MAQFCTKNVKGKIFQRLLFLIRDWANFHQYNYGYEDSQDYLDNVVLDSKPTHTQDMKDLRRYLKDSFDSIDCFLMPNPGHEVVDSRNFDGRWAELSTDFIANLKTLISTEFSPENLLKKKVFGEEATAQTLYEAIKGFQQVLNSPDVPSGRSIYNSFASGHLDKLIDSLLHEYKALIREKSATVESVDELEKAHNTMVNDLKINYDNTKKLGDKKLHEKYYKMLMKNINDDFENIKIFTTMRLDTKKIIAESQQREKRIREEYEKLKSDINKRIQDLELDNKRLRNLRDEESQVQLRQAEEQIQMLNKRLLEEKNREIEKLCAENEKQRKAEIELKKENDRLLAEKNQKKPDDCIFL